MKSTKNSFFIPFIVFAILILIVALSLKNIYELNNNSKWVVHTYEVKMALANNLSSLTDMETGQRGFSLTGSNDFLEYENSAKTEIDKNILQLRRLLKDNPTQLLKLDSLKQLIDLKIAFNVKVIKARNQFGLNAAVAITSTRRGKQIMDDTRKISGHMLEIEQKLLNDRNKTMAHSYFLAQIFIIVGGILSLLIAIFLIITNNKSLKLKNIILQSEEKFKSIFDNSLAAVLVADDKGNYLSANKAAGKLLGYSVTELLQMNIDDLKTTVQPDAAKRYEDYIRKGEEIGEFDFFTKNGEHKLAQYQASRTAADFNLSILMDITAQKQASEYARSLIEASLDPLVTISPEGKITDVNEASVKVTGETRAKLIGTDFSDYFTEPEKAREGYKQVFDKGFVSDYPLTIHHKNGKLTDVLYNASVYTDDKANVLGVFAAARDVTEQKRISEELKEARIVADLATITAEDAKDVAENALHSKQQFLSNMSHEIRTPMNAILGFTKILLKSDFAPEQKEYLDAIKASGDGLLVLINDILDLAKVDAGKMIFEQTPFKMEASINTMLQVFDLKTQENNLKLVKEYDNKIPKVLLGDATRLHQILLNLISNAIKFTAKGKITIAVNLLYEDKEIAIIEFAITDTGTGIPENKFESIFANFQQATSSTARLFGGTGLGLAICKQLIEKQGGTILVKSKVDQGSTFSFTLSFQKFRGACKEESAEVELEKEIKDIKILVVEDIKLNQLLMQTILDDFKFKHDIADNGKIAIEKMQTETYDIILMDLQMPEMNGFEATKYIRNTMKSNIPIIALTADVTTVDLEKCMAIGMNDYVSKPLDEQILHAKIIELLKQ
jgi:PAS domain S-box-containing protein